jgi:hypothetical protein
MMRFLLALTAFLALAVQPALAGSMLLLGVGGPPAATGGSFTTLDPTNKGTGASTGAGNLIYTTTTGNANVRSLASMTSGLHKFEITFNGSTAPVGTFGVCSAGYNLSGGYMGADYGFGFDTAGDWGVVRGSTGDGTLTAGETIAIEFNAGTGDLYYVTSRGRYGPYNITTSSHISPASPFFFCSESDNANGSASWTFNFGSSAWVRTTTSGYVGL